MKVGWFGMNFFKLRNTIIINTRVFRLENDVHVLAGREILMPCLQKLPFLRFIWDL